MQLMSVITMLFIKQRSLAEMKVAWNESELSILPRADETHHVTLLGHKRWLWGLLWRKELWPKQKGAAALTRLCHLMTLAPDTAASGCLSCPVTTTLWWIIDFPSLLQNAWAARPIHQLSSAGRIIKRSPFLKDPPYYHVWLCWPREPGAAQSTRQDSVQKQCCWLVHFGGWTSSSVVFSCLLLETLHALSCDGKWGSTAPDLLSHGWYRTWICVSGAAIQHQISCSLVENSTKECQTQPQSFTSSWRSFCWNIASFQGVLWEGMSL